MATIKLTTLNIIGKAGLTIITIAWLAFTYILLTGCSNVQAEILTDAQPNNNECYSVCKAWDTFCKSPKQIVATKCRLGVPVKHEQCEALGIPSHYMVRGGGSLVEAMPCTFENEAEIL